MKLMILLLGLVFCTTTLADPWSSKTKVGWLYPHSGGYNFSTKDYTNTELSTCDGGKRFRIALDHPNYDALVGSLVTAFVAGKTIRININGEEGPSCSPSIDRMFVFN